MSQHEEKLISRRHFLKNTGFTVGGLALGAGLTQVLGTKPDEPLPQVELQHQATVDYSEGMQFFTRKEDFEALAAATEVIFPEDEHGSGAIGLGAPFYIDKQLASPWGRNADDYMMRPYKNGQNAAIRGDVMLEGLRKMGEVSTEKHQNLFHSLKEEEQISILQEFESGKVEMRLTSSAAFFGLLRQLTLEGCFCDPLYGGNKNLEGWKMKEFPGAYMSHVDVVESRDFVLKKPQSLSAHL